MYRVILVDDQPIFRDIIRGVLQRTGRFQFIGEAENGVEAVEMYRKLRPDVVIMDVQMSQLNGFEATARIREQDPEAVVVLTSMRADDNYSLIAKQSGAVGFLPKRGLDAYAVLSMLEDSGGEFQRQAA
jgi:DNA-binding NarL/FixJ family response regulator